MNWPPWCHHEPDNTDHLERVEQVEAKAERQLVRAHEVAHQATRGLNTTQDTVRRNHMGESLEIAYRRRQKRSLPWSR